MLKYKKKVQIVLRIYFSNFSSEMAGKLSKSSIELINYCYFRMFIQGD